MIDLCLLSIYSSTIHLGTTESTGRLGENAVYDAINRNAMGRSFSRVLPNKRARKNNDDEKDSPQNDKAMNGKSQDTSAPITDTAAPNIADEFTPLPIHKRPRDDSDDENDEMASIQTKEPKVPTAPQQPVQNKIDENVSGDTVSPNEMKALEAPKEEPEVSLTSPTSYIGETDDNEWWKEVPPKRLPHQWMHPKPTEEDKTIKRKEENKEIYEGLLDGMGTFRYQNA